MERTNATIASAVRTMTTIPNEWDVNIRDIQLALNEMKNKTTQRSSHELMFNYEPRNALQNALILALQEDVASPQDIEDKRIEALERIRDQQKKQKIQFDKRHKKPRKYEVDDLVLVEREAAATGESKKLTARFKGPYMVAVVLPHARYRLVDVPGARRTQRTFNSIFASDRMKSWCQPLNDVDDEEGYLSTEEGGSNCYDNCSQGCDLLETEDGLHCQEGPTVSVNFLRASKFESNCAPIARGRVERSRGDAENLG